jgi:excisionase family DNA binding protein
MNEDIQMTRLLTAFDVSEMLGITPYHVYRLAKEGTLPSYKFSSKNVRFKQEDIDAYIEDHRRESQNNGHG